MRQDISQLSDSLSSLVATYAWSCKYTYFTREGRGRGMLFKLLWDDLEVGAFESSRKLAAKCISIMMGGGKCHSRNWQYPALQTLDQNVFPTEAVSSRRQRKAKLPAPGCQVLPLHLGVSGRGYDKESSNERDADLVFPQVCKSNEHQESNENALPSKRTGDQLPSHKSKGGRTTATNINFCFALFARQVWAPHVSQADWNTFHFFSVSRLSGYRMPL